MKRYVWDESHGAYYDEHGNSPPKGEDLVRAEDFAACWDRVHSDEFVVMFMGFLWADGRIAAGVTQQQMLQSWARFKIEMGKK